ncbi:MAG: hypothetical protein NUV58_04805, partial [Candidatus Roizmanbacteria bacterium]|nr:hypothetical protein [Candidatus Roizmanbacteria bacterium]
ENDKWHYSYEKEVIFMIDEFFTVNSLHTEKGEEWKGEFAPNLGHDPNNPFPLGTTLKPEDFEEAKKSVRKK